MVIKGFFSNSAGIVVSRILGLCRDLLSASILGAGVWADIFFIAFKVPNLFRRIFGEGAFSQAFLPAFTISRFKGAFAASVFLRFALAALFACALVTVFSVPFTRVIATGLSEDEIISAAPLVGINFFYLFFIYCVTFLGALLQYEGHFATTAFSTSLLNLSMICALIIAREYGAKEVAYALSYGVIIGGILQVLLHIFVISKKRMGPTLYLAFKDKILSKNKKRQVSLSGFYSQFTHALVGSSALQLSAFIDTWLASFLASGAISYLFYANRIFQLPLAVFAIALAQPLFVRINRLLKSNDESTALSLISKSGYVLLFLLASAALWGIGLSEFIVWLLFERGNFSAADTVATAEVLSAYLVGLVPFGLAKIFSLWLYAKMAQKTAAKIAILSVVINLILAAILMQYLGAAGIALASSIGGFLQLGLYLFYFGRKNFFAIISLKKSLILILAIATQGLILVGVKEFINVYLR
ncbi:murein biosynthesis integral membrane protein MurJ [Campylobacter sp. 19-13652]|uniref:murein biosynthesis integral membrane protein MurJ n=1 Tax=Campylobacter sp. 19-13652 TaxID=2840180 RepID=UPI001C783F71|nr:murein biosynthesis integral membrane protein MurJ [Campylobacter sp. 19-13652]BCX79469.1 putative lipid II flippase MurJ [Campylobacter sp. 19-13652]